MNQVNEVLSVRSSSLPSGDAPVFVVDADNSARELLEPLSTGEKGGYMIVKRGPSARSIVDMSGATPTVFVVADDASMHESLDVLIRSAGWRPKTARSAEEFLAGPRVMAPSCIVSELRLPGMSGLDLQRLVAERLEMPIIFMSEHVDVQAAVRAMKGGAFEVLSRPIAADLLVTTIQCAIERSRAALNHLGQIQGLEERYASLSAREREVMSLVVSGRLNKQVSGELGITEFTVKAHRGRMMRKMRARSFAELVTMVETLRRWTGVMTASIGVPPEPLVGYSTLVQSLRPGTSGVMSV